MSKIMIAGLINIETTLKVNGFPIEYYPIDYPFYGIRSAVSGVAINIAKAISVLGEEVNVISLIGQDEEADRVEKMFDNNAWTKEFVKKELTDTPQSVVLYEPSGRRKIYCDLKDIQDQSYPEEVLEEALKDCKAAMICNINFARPLLQKAKQKNIIIATDVHVLSDIQDSYNKDFMEYADILFLSDENLPHAPEKFMLTLKNNYSCKVIVLGQGKKGAMIYIREENAIYQIDAVHIREVVNTVGAGDSLFSAFVHYYVNGYKPIEALKRAEIFASYKIGEDGAAKGFIDENRIEDFYKGIDFKIIKVF
jgi:ribokinase